MHIGQKLLDLRKEKHLSQEEVADKLNVTRQTVSKWETEQSTPDFDKIIPLCELYGITADELFTGKKKEEITKEEVSKEETNMEKVKKAKGIGMGIFLYFISIIWIMVTIPVFKMNPILSSAVFLLFCGFATYMIVYTSIVYKKKKTKEEDQESKIVKQINEVIAIIVLFFYLLLSFLTMAWYITWVLWIVYALIEEIVKLIFMIKENKNEE